MKTSTRIRYFFHSSVIKIKKFIKKNHHNTLLYVKSYIKDKQLLTKTGLLIVYLAEVAFTGLVLFYALTNFNWLSCGIWSAVGMYYIDWFINLVMAKKD